MMVRCFYGILRFCVFQGARKKNRSTAEFAFCILAGGWIVKVGWAVWGGYGPLALDFFRNFLRTLPSFYSFFEFPTLVLITGGGEKLVREDPIYDG